MVQGSDGNLFGTTQTGGVGFTGVPAYGHGTIFQISTRGELTTLFRFNGTNGVNPRGMLVLGKDGSLFGTTEYGGKTFGEHDNGAGTIFCIKVTD